MSLCNIYKVDKVKYSKIFKLLIKRNVCPLIIRLLLNMYLINTAAVKWNDELSSDFNVCNGVKQGGVLSPHLFTVYVDPLIHRLRNSGIGCKVGPLISNVFVYADDVIILSPTLSSLYKLIQICESYGAEYELTFNPDKCFLLIYADRTIFNFDHVIVKIWGQNVKIVELEEYLGNSLTTNRYIIDIGPSICDMKARTNRIVNNFNNISCMSKAQLFNSQCLALYGAQLWNLSDPKIEEYNVTWRKSVRYLLGLHARTKSYILPYIMNSFNIKDVIMERQLNFCVQVYNHKSDYISGYMKNSLLSLTSYTLSNVNKILNKFQITYADLFNIKKSHIKKLIKNSYPPMDWRAGMTVELLHALDGQLDMGLSRQELRILLDEICTCDI